MSSLALVLCVATLGLATNAVKYDGYKVVRVTPNNLHDANWVHETIQDMNLNIWNEPRGVGHFTDVMIAPNQASTFLGQLKHKDINHYVMMEDVQKTIDDQKSYQRNDTRKFDHTAYHTLEDIYEIILHEADNHDLLTVEDLGAPTYEGNQQKLVKISSGGDNTRPVVWIDCGISAREWIGPAVCQYIMDSILEGWSKKDPRTMALIDKYDFFIIPVVNPDGYSYTWSEDRLWKKNRMPYGICHGTDLDMNFDSDFGGPGTYDSPCSDKYHGPSAFSEIESQNLRDILLKLDYRTKVLYTIRSYAQLWMIPYSYTYDLPSNYNSQYAVAESGVEALEDVYGTKYDYGNAAEVCCLQTGRSIDWAYDTVGIQYTFLLKLRDIGSYGLLLPADQIIPTAEETMEGILASIEAI